MTVTNDNHLLFKFWKSSWCSFFEVYPNHSLCCPVCLSSPEDRPTWQREGGACRIRLVPFILLLCSLIVADLDKHAAVTSKVMFSKDWTDLTWMINVFSRNCILHFRKNKVIVKRVFIHKINLSWLNQRRKWREKNFMLSLACRNPVMKTNGAEG